MTLLSALRNEIIRTAGISMAFVKVLIIITIVFNGQNNLEAKSLGLVTNDPGKTNIEDNDNGRRNIDSSSYSK